LRSCSASGNNTEKGRIRETKRATKSKEDDNYRNLLRHLNESSKKEETGKRKGRNARWKGETITEGDLGRPQLGGWARGSEGKDPIIERGRKRPHHAQRTRDELEEAEKKAQKARSISPSRGTAADHVPEEKRSKEGVEGETATE